MFYMKSDRFVAQLIYKVSLPVPLQTWWIEAVEHALQPRKGHGREKFEGRVSECAQRLENLICLFQRIGGAPYDAAHFFEMQIFRERWRGWNCKKCKKAVDLFWCVDDELAIPLHEIGGLLQVP